MTKAEVLEFLDTEQDPRGIANWKKHAEDSGGLKGVVARLTMEPELPHHPGFHVVIAFETGRPSSNIRFSTLQASNTSALCDFG